MASSSRIIMVPLGAVLLSVPSLGCLTSNLFFEAKGGVPHQAKITAIQSASVQGDKLLLRVEIDPSGRAAPRDAQLRIPIAHIGSFVSSGSGYEVGNVALESRELACLESPDFSSIGSTSLRIRGLRVKSYEDFESALKALPVGVHVVALTFDDQAQDGQSSWTEGDEATLDHRSSTTVLVMRGDDGSTKHTMIWGFDEQPKKRRALLLLTPLTVVGDIVTFPLQLLAALIVDC